jgi:hypothetical protein
VRTGGEERKCMEVHLGLLYLLSTEKMNKFFISCTVLRGSSNFVRPDKRSNYPGPELLLVQR